MTPPQLPQGKPRSLIVTLLAWVMMGTGVIGLPISIITVLMFLAHSYGTANADFVDSCLVILGPLVAISVGFALWRRWGWGRAGALAILGITMTMQVQTLMKDLGPGNSSKSYTTTSSSGVTITVSGSSPNYHSWPILLLCAGAVIKLMTRNVRNEFSGIKLTPPAKSADNTRPAASSDQQVWRVGHRGRDAMYYEEMIEGNWQRLELDGEMLMGRAHHVIYFCPPEQWQRYPEWARYRRSEIIARIKSAFRAPDYEYQMETGAIPQPPVTNVLPALSAKDIVTPKQTAAVWTVILILLAITCTMGWIVTRGIERGEVTMPSKRATLQRPLSRAQEPASFWAALGVYTLIGLGTGLGSLWLGRVAWRMK